MFCAPPVHASKVLLSTTATLHCNRRVRDGRWYAMFDTVIQYSEKCLPVLVPSCCCTYLQLLALSHFKNQEHCQTWLTCLHCTLFLLTACTFLILQTNKNNKHLSELMKEEFKVFPLHSTLQNVNNC